MDPERIEARIKTAGRLIGAGFMLQLISLLGVHPLAFVVFLGIGCPLVGAGIVLYLVSLPHD